MDYLTIPFALKDGHLPRASAHESISFSVGMILSSRVGMMHFYRKFGCEVWEKEFSDLYTTNKADIRANLRNAIDKFEKRLYNISVTFSSEPTLRARVLGMRVKVSGNYRDDEREEKFESTYLLG